MLSDDSALEAAMTALEQVGERSEQIRRSAAESTFTATSKNKILTATVSGQGELRKINFRGEGYRSLAPVELASLIVQTVEEARKQSRTDVMASIQDLFPRMASPLDLLNKPDVTLDDLMNHMMEVAGSLKPEDGDTRREEGRR